MASNTTWCLPIDLFFFFFIDLFFVFFSIPVRKEVKAVPIHVGRGQDTLVSCIRAVLTPPPSTIMESGGTWIIWTFPQSIT